jgi:hypothetical protein
MLRELENLLQEITEQRPAKAPPRSTRPPAQPPPIEYLDAETAEIIEAEPVGAHEAVADHVTQHLDTSDITSRTSLLGATVGMADDKLEARIHGKFDHDLSKIDERPTVAAEPVKPTASEIAELLRSPKSIRQAVILSEILNRPYD